MTRLLHTGFSLGKYNDGQQLGYFVNLIQVASRSQIIKCCRNTKHALARAPWHFLVLQIPEGLFDAIEKLITPVSEKFPLFTLIVILPLVWLLSALSISLTFASIQRLEKQTQLSLWDTASAVASRLKQLIPASFLVGLVVLCGLLLLVPGIYFMAIYLFVPQLVMSSPTYPATTYLHLSKKLGRSHLKMTLLIVLIIFLLDFTIYILGETLGTWLGGATVSSTGQNLILIMTKIFLSLTTSAAINIFVSYYFLEIFGE